MEGGGMYKDCSDCRRILSSCNGISIHNGTNGINYGWQIYPYFFLNEVPWYRCEWDMSISVNYVHSALKNASLKL